MNHPTLARTRHGTVSANPFRQRRPRLMRERLGFIAGALAACLSMGCPAPPHSTLASRLAPRPGEPTVRIGLVEATGSVRIEADQGLRLVAGETVRLAPSFTLSSSRGHIAVNGTRIPHKRVTCFASTPLNCNGVPYRGQMEISVVEGALRVVNIVGLEEYLAGVVPAEIGRLSTREIEAVKAQAIAARTYTVANRGRRRAQGFDLYADIRDQVYMGVRGEHAVATRAIEQTRGQILTYRGEPIQAFFHSTCGGFTANIEDVWDSDPLPYLKGVPDRDSHGFHCETSRHFRWSEEYSPGALRTILSENLFREVPNAPRKIGTLRKIDAPERSSSGRVRYLSVETNRGRWRIRKDRIRWALRRPVDGNPILRSTYIRIFSEYDGHGSLLRVLISGAGNGHGVGMCQWGAIGMARKGYSVDQILAHYYRGTAVSGLRGAD